MNLFELYVAKRKKNVLILKNDGYKLCQNCAWTLSFKLHEMLIKKTIICLKDILYSAQWIW